MHPESRPAPAPNPSTPRPGEHFLAHPVPALWAACVMLALVALMAILVPAEPLVEMRHEFGHADHEEHRALRQRPRTSWL